MPGQVKAHGLPNQAVDLWASSDVEFQRTLDTKFPGLRGRGSFSAHLPYSVLMENKSAHTIAAYTIEWGFQSHEGSSLIFYTSFSEPNVIRTGRSIGPADSRLQPHTIRLLSPYFNMAEAQLALQNSPTAQANPVRGTRLTRAIDEGSQVSVSIDGVFFSDGSYVGPDRSAYFDHFRLQNNARHDVAVAILQASADGSSDAAIQDILQADIDRAGQVNITLTKDPGSIYTYYLGIEAQTLLQSFVADGRRGLLANAEVQGHEEPLKLSRK
jgi:hypothetical protein